MKAPPQVTLPKKRGRKAKIEGASTKGSMKIEGNESGKMRTIKMKKE